MNPARLLNQLFLIIILLALGREAAAQCINWSASAQLTTAASCAGNGAFTVTLQGPDAANLTNVQYGVPLMPSGFSVPLSGAATFVNMAAGTYPISVVADCGGGTVGRNTSIVVPGNYKAPAWLTSAFDSRPSFSCKPTGWIRVAVRDGIPPYTFTLTGYPAGYTGPRVFTSRFGSVQIPDLPAGTYTVQASDSCNSGTAPTTMAVASLNSATAPMGPGFMRVLSCDSIVVFQPSLAGGGTPWNHYWYDTMVKVSYEIPSVIPPTTPVRAAQPYNIDSLRLPAGKTVRDLYGNDVRVTIYLPCGLTQTLTYPIGAPPQSTVTIYQRCDSSILTWFTSLGNNACLPISYTVTNKTTAASYGPFIVQGISQLVPYPQLPVGAYSVAYTTGDGYSSGWHLNILAPQTPAYSVAVMSGANGLNGFIEGFRISRVPATAGGNARIELVSAPSGYTYLATSVASFPHLALRNASPTPSSLVFSPGSYVWKITDECGVRYLNVTVTSADLYQFTAGTPLVQETCQGVNVFPAGTSTNSGISYPVNFAVFKDGFLYSPPGTGALLFAAGMPIPLSEPGTYHFVTTAGLPTIGPGFYNPGGFRLGLPNIYTSASVYVYNRFPLMVDLNATQGFICAGAPAGSARIEVKGKDGFPFRAGGAHYLYELALGGNGLTGPYLATNTTGSFSGFGGSANALYDVKVTDSCGAFAVQQIRILDLGNARLASSSRYVACMGDSIRLNAAFLPGASYTWTGPAGFSSTLRQPLIPSAGPATAGTYYVTITTTACNQTMRDSVRIVVNPSPAKPLLSYYCLPRPVRLFVANPQPGLRYLWDVGQNYSGDPDNFFHGPLTPSDSAYIKFVNRTGSYAVIAADTIYGCSTRSDSLILQSAPLDTLRASIYSPVPAICQGDSSMLVAKWTGGHPKPSIQWLRNGIPVTGATAQFLYVSQPGQYRVVIAGGPCNIDTSAAILMNVFSIPPDSLRASHAIICAGDTAVLTAASQPGYGYVWMRGGNVIPGAADSTLLVTVPGTYTVRVSNGSCVRQSKPVVISQRPAISVSLSHSGLVKVCSFEGDTVLDLITTRDTGWRYQWYRNGTALRGDTIYYYLPRQPGRYHVEVSSPYCGSRSSDTAVMVLLPRGIDLGADTLVCEEKAFPIRLAADTGYVSYRWSTGDTLPSIWVPAKGSYAVTASNVCGTFRDTIRVLNGDDFLPKFPDDTLICTSTQRLILRLPAGLSAIRWTDGSDEAQRYITQPGRYEVSAMGPCGPVRDSIVVEFCRPRILETEGLGPICQGDCLWPRARFDGYPNRFAWSFPGGRPAEATLPDPGRVCYDSAGTYPISLIVWGRGGSDTARMMITVNAPPRLRFRDTLVEAAYRHKLQLPACAAGSRADWYEDGVLICENCPELELEPRFHHGVYRCIVRAGDCPDSCSYTLRVVDIPDNVWLPNAFTPNGDGRNDYFGIITDNPNVQVGNLSVYNRWGERVFLSNGNGRGWDGSVKGRPADAGTYFWQLSYRILGRTGVFQQKGDVLLMR